MSFDLDMDVDLVQSKTYMIFTTGVIGEVGTAVWFVLLNF